MDIRGKRVVVTRTRDQAGEMVRLLEDRGAVPVIFPTIATVPPSDWGPVDRAINRIDSYDAVVFTSANGVRFFFDRAKEIGRDLGCLKDKEVWAIGTSTKSLLEDEGIGEVSVPPSFVAESLLEAMVGRGATGKNILLPRTEKARDILPEGLQKAGALVHVVDVYRTVIPGADASLRREVLDAHIFTFTSPSTVKGFLKMMGDSSRKALEDGLVVSIGPVTSRALMDMGLKVDVEARNFTVHGLIEALEEY